MTAPFRSKTSKRPIRLFYLKGIEQDLMENCSFPLALYTVAAYARADAKVAAAWDIDIQVLDYECQHEQVIYEMLRDGIEMAGFSCYLWNYVKAYRLIQKLKLALPQVKIVVGGPQVSDAQKVLEQNSSIDIVVHGEGEHAFRELLLAESASGDASTLAAIPGIAWRAEEGVVVAPPAPVVDLGDIPSVYENCNPEHLKGTMILETSRGCPYGCRFCAWGDTSMRYYPPHRVEQDLRMVLGSPDVEALFLIDAELDIDKRHAHHVMDTVRRYNTRGLPVTGFFSFGRWDEDLIRLGKQCNFKLGVGLQSLSRETLDLAGRKFLRRDKAARILSGLEKHYRKDEIQLQFILGLPGDGYAQIRECLDWCIQRGYFQLGINRLFVLPGTAFYRDSKRHGLVYDPGGYHAVYSTGSMSYHEILKAEMLVSGFRMFAHYGSRLPLAFWQDRGVDPVVVCEAVGQALAERGMCFLGRQENDSPEFQARDVAHIEARRVYVTVLEEFLSSEDCQKVQDVANFIHLRDRCHRRLARRADADEHEWRTAQPWRGLSFEILPVRFRFDVARYLQQADQDLGSFTLGDFRGYFVLQNSTAEVHYVQDLRRNGRWTVGPLLEIVAHKELLRNLGIPEDALTEAYEVDNEEQALFRKLEQLLESPKRPPMDAPLPPLRRSAPRYHTSGLPESEDAS